MGKKIEMKHVAAFLLAVTITVAIITFREQIRGLEQLGYLGVFLAMLLTNATLFLPTPTIVLAIAFGAALPNPYLSDLRRDSEVQSEKPPAIWQAMPQVAW